MVYYTTARVNYYYYYNEINGLHCSVQVRPCTTICFNRSQCTVQVSLQVLGVSVALVRLRRSFVLLAENG